MFVGKRGLLAVLTCDARESKRAKLPQICVVWRPFLRPQKSPNPGGTVRYFGLYFTWIIGKFARHTLNGKHALDFIFCCVCASLRRLVSVKSGEGFRPLVCERHVTTRHDSSLRADSHWMLCVKTSFDSVLKCVSDRSSHVTGALGVRQTRPCASRRFCFTLRVYFWSLARMSEVQTI